MEQVTVEQALECILKNTAEIKETERISVLQAAGRILAEDMTAGFDNPPFHRSPVDGYACRAEDLSGADREHPVYLKVAEEIDAGSYSERIVRSGEAVRIMTGAAIPQGCDCCVYQEMTDYGEEIVAVYCERKTWDNVCFKGEDFKKGDVLLKAGTKIGFVEAGILAGMGLTEVPVYRLPKVALLTSGDEVVDPGNPLPQGKIYNINQTLLAVRMKEFGISVSQIETIEDDPQKMADALLDAAEKADLIITTGGVSVGKKDIMHEALRLSGAQRIFWRILMKPGMPTLFSVCKGVPVLSMSGNPFGVAVAVDVLARPALQKLKKDCALCLVRVKGTMADSFPKSGKGRRFIRASYRDGKFYLPQGLHSNGVLASMAGCNCLIDWRPDAPRLEAGAYAEAILL